MSCATVVRITHISLNLDNGVSIICVISSLFLVASSDLIVFYESSSSLSTSIGILFTFVLPSCSFLDLSVGCSLYSLFLCVESNG